MFQRILIASWSMKMLEQGFTFHLILDAEDEGPGARNHDPILIVNLAHFKIKASGCFNELLILEGPTDYFLFK